MNLSADLRRAMDLQFARLMSYELKEDFPMLRLHKSVQAYRIIATFQTIPLNRRMEAALACTPSSQPKTERQMGLRQAFFNRKESHTLAELNAMSFDPMQLDPQSEPCDEMQAGDEFATLVRQSQERLMKREIVHQFLTAVKSGYEPVVQRCHDGPSLYEAFTELGSWDLTTRLDFGEAYYRFNCSFSVRHQKTGESVWFTPGGLVGFGDILGWDDVTRDTLEQDAAKALQLCLAIRSFITNIVRGTGS